MPHSFRLLLLKNAGAGHIYRATFGEDVESFLLFDEEAGAVQVCDAQGVAVGSMSLHAGTGNVENPVADPVEVENFTMAAAHLLARWRRTGTAPAEIVKVFS
jgi:hypothetical protein